MWPFSKNQPKKPEEWLTLEQAGEVTKIFYADHDANCWYACALLPNHEGVRIAAASQQEATELASALAQEVFAKTGRRFTVQEGP